jgi:hypothetical protein
LQRLREIMGKLKLTVNEEKTQICMGYTLGRMYSARTGQARLGYPHHIRFTPVSDRTADIAGGPVRANMRHRRLSLM